MTKPGTTTFHRPARVVTGPVEHAGVTIAAPPTVPEPFGNGVWQVLAPVLGSAGMVGFALVLGERRYMIMAGLLAGVMLASGVVSRIVQVRGERTRRQRAALRYQEHLSSIRSQLDRSAAIQRSFAERNYPEPADLYSIVADSASVWERRPEHADFLAVRLGLGSMPAALFPVLEQPHDPMTVAEPLLLTAATSLREETTGLRQFPITVDLADVGCLAVIGDRERARDLVRSIVAQLVAFRAPTDLGVMGWFPSDDIDHWDWMKWLPHARSISGPSDDGRTMLTTAHDDLGLLLEQIAVPRISALERRHSSYRSDEALGFRQMLLIIDGYHPESEVGELGIIDRAIAASREIGLLAVCLVDGPSAVPSHAAAQLTLRTDGTTDYLDMRDPDRSHSGVIADRLDIASSSQIGRALAPLRIRTDATPASVDSPGLLELLDISPTQLGVPTRWAVGAAAPLTAPIGIGTDGEPLELDLREASAGGMGPHGVLIGATGSGKSELLRMLVLGLAMRNSPEELSFVFADFKGGATFAGLDRLPHTAGSITNIESDPKLIDRMQEALSGELERRQRILRDQRFDRADEYRRNRQELNHHLEPLPALVLVVDEFGELLAHRPEFVELFASIGRTGRSLGVHLLLASQRLDEGRIRPIESHLRYRICLRTFSAEESMATIGSRASFELPPVPGLGYVAVDGTLNQFKAGIVNRPIRAITESSAIDDVAIRRFDLEGPSTIGSAATVSSATPAEAITEMQLITNALGRAGGVTRQVWMPPLDEMLQFQPIEVDGSLRVVLGKSDLPREQRIIAAVHDFSGTSGNLAIVGGPRSGKSTALGTIIASLSHQHGPDQVAVYAVDLGGGALHRFEDLPHVGAVLGRSNREEVPRLIRQLTALIEQRVELFREYRLSSMTEFCNARAEGRSEDSRGHVFLAIDQWAMFSQEFGHELAEAVADIVNGGLHYGVHVILTASRWQDIRMSLRDNIGGRLELRLTDPIESEIDRRAAERVPPDTPGRAIDSTGRLTQIMLPPTEFDDIHVRWLGHPPAPKVTILPTQLDASDVSVLDPSAIGVEEHGLAPWKPKLDSENPHFVVVGDGGAGKTSALRGLISSLSGAMDPGTCAIALIDYRAQLVTTIPADLLYGTATTPDAASALVASIVREVSDRSPSVESSPPGRRRIILIVDDYDLVSGGTSNPLAGLIDTIPRARDLEFSLVIARKSAGMSRSAFEPVLQRLRELATPTLVMDGDPGEGPVAGAVKATRQPVGRGVLVSRSKSTLIQLAEFRPSLQLVNEEASA